jgi:hypothetical protein
MKCLHGWGVQEGETFFISMNSNRWKIAETLAAAAYAVGGNPISIV